MSALDVATQLEPNHETDSAGYRLRTARERLDLSLRDVASELNLMVSHVRGIETDRFAELNNDKLFLRHLHEYASLLDLNADEIVDMYRSQSAAAAATIQVRPSRHAQRYDSKWIAVGALAVACVGLGAWSLVQTLPSAESGSSAKSISQTARNISATTPQPAANDRVEIPAVRDATKSTASKAGSGDAAGSAAAARASSEKAKSNKQSITPPAAKTLARSDPADTYATSLKSRRSNATGSASSVAKVKNALRAVGAKPLRKTLVELKNQEPEQAQDRG